MKTNLICSFHRIQGEDGKAYYKGSFSPSSLRKAKRNEIEVILVPSEAVPNLSEFMRKAGKEEADLLMFGVVEEDKKGKARNP